MKEMRQKIAVVMEYIYGIGIFIALFAGGLSCLGYIVALIIGGDIAEKICVFMYKNLYPILFCFASCVALFGLLKMYIAGEKSMVPSKRKLKSSKTTTTEAK